MRRGNGKGSTRDNVDLRTEDMNDNWSDMRTLNTEHKYNINSK